MSKRMTEEELEREMRSLDELLEMFYTFGQSDFRRILILSSTVRDRFLEMMMEMGIVAGLKVTKWEPDKGSTNDQ